MKQQESIKQPIKLIYTLQKEVKELKEYISTNAQYNLVLKKENRNLMQNLEILKSCIEILSSHISVLEQKNKGLKDRFRFVRFKDKSLDKELKQRLNQFKVNKEAFTLNDD